MFSWRFVPGLYHIKMLQSPTNRFGSKTHWLPDLSSPVASWIRFPGRFKVVPSLDFCRQICSSKAAIVCWYKATCRFFLCSFRVCERLLTKTSGSGFHGTSPRQNPYEHRQKVSHSPCRKIYWDVKVPTSDHEWCTNSNFKVQTYCMLCHCNCNIGWSL